MNNNLFPCIWLNKNGNAAAKFYLETFENTKITEDTPMVKMLEFSGQKLMLLDADSPFKPNPCISLLIAQKDEQETERLYTQLKGNGKILMPLDSYPFSKKYAWVEDQFGVSWQLYTGEKGDTDQYFVPHLMWVKNNNGKAKEAMNFYTSIFKDSSIKGVLEYVEEEEDTPGNVKHAQFQLNDFMLS